MRHLAGLLRRTERLERDGIHMVLVSEINEMRLRSLPLGDCVADTVSITNSRHFVMASQQLRDRYPESIRASEDRGNREPSAAAIPDLSDNRRNKDR